MYLDGSMEAGAAGGAGGAFSPKNNVVWEGAGIVSPSSAPEARAKY